ncbi:MAG: tetratricopeptide repeat protein [Planctomycetes bacterium]|nr:tetratricopeptide repeat protein [Planctomycetota bacterium]
MTNEPDDKAGPTRVSTSAPALDPTKAAVREGQGTRIDAYQLIQKIGEGGFGVVFLAEQKEPVQRRVALKIVKLGLDTHQVVARFEAERQALAMMDHPNIAKVFDAGATESGRPYFVMELVVGQPITQFCDAHRMPTRERLSLFLDVCHAVQHAHQKGLIHRDLKPTNVLVAEVEGKPVVKVIDFGVAKATGGRLTELTLVTEIGQMVGTPTYMSPEQAGRSDIDVDTRSDIYSLGVLLYELLTGVTPFDTATLRLAAFTEVVRVICEVDAPRPSTRVSSLGEALAPIAESRGIETRSLTRLLRGELDWIVMRALEKDRTRRYQSASGLAADVTRYLNGEPIVAAPPSRIYRLRKLARRHRILFAALGGIAAALLIGTGLAIYGLVQARREQANAVVQRDRAIAAEGEQTRLREQSDLERDRARKAEAAAAASAEEARAAAKRADTVNRFLVDVLGQAELRKAGRQVTVVDALARASKSVVDSFKDQPDIAADVQLQLGKTYASLGMYPEAEAQLQAAKKYHDEHHDEAHPDYPTLLQRLGSTVGKLGRRAEGESLLRRAIALAEEHGGPEDLVALGAKSDLAIALVERGAMVEAESIFREVLDVYRRRFGPDALDSLIALNALAWCLHKEGQVEKAEPLYREAVERADRALGKEHPDSLIFIQNYGSVLVAMNQLDRAEAIERDGVERFRRVYGNDHPTTATAIDNLAKFLTDRKQNEEAERLYREVLDIDRKAFGGGPNVVTALTNLVVFLTNRGDAAAAEAPAREAFDLARKDLGAEAHDTVLAEFDLANVLGQLDKLPEAEPLFRESIELSKKVLGPEDRETLVRINTFAVALHGADRLEDAEKFYRESLSIEERALGIDHPDTLISRFNIAQLVGSRGRLEEAERMNRDVIEPFRRVFGEKHPNTAGAIAGLGDLLRKEKRPAEALELYRQALAIQTEALAPNHPSLRRTLQKIANALREEGEDFTTARRYGDATEVFREALETCDKIDPPPEAVIANVESAYGACLSAQGKLEDAKKLLSSARTRQVREKSVTLDDRKKTLSRFVDLYEKWSKPDDVAKWRAALAAESE